MKKFYLGVAFMLVLCAGDARAAGFQVDGVRVGPAAEEKVTDADAPAPKKDEKKSARPSEEAKNSRDSERPKESSKSAGGVSKERERPNDKGRNASTLSNSTASASAPSASDNASGTTDAPSKPGAKATVPVGVPVKNASAPAADPEADRNTTTQPNASGNQTNAPANSNSAANPSATTAPVAGSASSTPAANSTTTASAPLTSVYRIGIGDVLDIRLLNDQDPRQSTLYTVLAGGVLDYPLLRDPLTVAGMTTDELAAQLIADFRHRGVFEHPQVRVGVREYASHAVLVSGLANDPGTKILRREAIPLYVIVAEAQPKPEAGRAVIISHTSDKVTTVDLNDAAGLNTLVQPGDVVNLTVRPPEFFYIGGEVGSPGQKDFHAGMTLTQAVLASGGATRLAGDKVRVARAGADGRLVSTEYNLSEIEGGVVPDPLLQAGDRIEVSARANKK